MPIEDKMLRTFSHVVKITPPVQPLFVHTTSSDDNWIEELKAQPLYHFGALAREGFDQIVSVLKGTFNLLLSKLGDFEALKLYNALVLDDESALIQLAQTHKHHSASINAMIKDIKVKDHHIQQARRKLIELIDAAFKQSEEENKPLLILIGEEHHKSAAAFANAVALLASIDRLPIKQIHTEAWYTEHYPDRSSALGLRVIEKIAHKYDIQLIPMDYATCSTFDPQPMECAGTEYPQTDAPTSPEGIITRNTVMADVLSQSAEKVAVGIVGAYHLQGLIKETSLTKEFVVLPISTSCFQDRSLDQALHPLSDYSKSEDVFQFGMAEVMPEGLDTYFTVTTKARKIHESAKRQDEAIANQRKAPKP